MSTNTEQQIAAITSVIEDADPEVPPFEIVRAVVLALYAVGADEQGHTIALAWEVCPVHLVDEQICADDGETSCEADRNGQAGHRYDEHGRLA